MIGDSRRVTLQKQAIGKLIITVIEASDLIASSDGKSDPFCVVRVGDDGQEGHTPVIKNALNPHWNYAVSKHTLPPPPGLFVVGPLVILFF